MPLSDSSGGDVNPYAAPLSPETLEPSVPVRTRWRVGWVTVMLIFGIVGFLGGPISLVVALQRPAALGGGLGWLRIAGATFQCLGGACWISGALACWKGRWRAFVTLAMVGLALFILARKLLLDLGL